MAILSYFSKRFENNAPAVAGAMTYGAARLNPLMSKQDAQALSSFAQQQTQSVAATLQPVARAVDAQVVSTGSKLAGQGLKVADTVTGGAASPLAAQVLTDATAMYDKASTLAPILTIDNKPKSYGADLLAGKEILNKELLAKAPVNRQQFLEKLQAAGIDLDSNPQLKRLDASLSGKEGSGLETDGYTSLLEIYRKKGAKGSEELVAKLNRFLDGPAHQGNAKLKRQITSDALRDIAFPTTIEQGSKGNCGAIAVQQIWAKQDPSSYLDALTSLASDRPHQFKNGQILTPLNAAISDPKDDRNASVKVLGDALSLYAHERSPVRQAGLHVARSTAEQWGLQLGKTPLDNYHPQLQKKGIHAPQELATVLSDITGKNYAVETLRPTDQGLAQAADGKPVATLVSGKLNSEWHWIQMTGAQGNEVDLSSWGATHRVTQKDLAPYVRAVLIEK